MTREERLEEFFRRLLRAPPQNTAAESKWLLAVTLNAVEDELTDFPYDPEHFGSNDRMYPVPDEAWADLGGAFVARSRGHQIYVGRNGAIEICRRSDGAILMSKPGANGRGIEP